MVEEDWDAEDNNVVSLDVSIARNLEQNDEDFAIQPTLKITDGYKYSYEANVSPANVDDWLDPPSFGFGGSSSCNGFAHQNGYGDSNNNQAGTFRNKRDAQGNFKRFNKRSDNFSNQNGNAMDDDWDATNNMNGIADGPAAADEDWDEPMDTAPASRQSSVQKLDTFNGNQQQAVSSKSVGNDDDDNWDDEPSGANTQSQPTTPSSLGFFNPKAARQNDAAEDTIADDNNSYLGAGSKSADDNNDFAPRPRGFMAKNDYNKQGNFNNRFDKRDNWNNRNKFGQQNQDFNSGSRNDYHSNKSSYNNTPNVSVAEEEENWDDEPADTSKQSQPSTPNSLGFFNPNAAKKDDDAAATADGANKNDDGSYLGADNQSTNNNDDFIPRPRGFMAENDDRGRNFNNRYDKRDNWGNRNDRRDNYNNRNDRRDNWNNRNKFDPRNRDFNSESKNDFHSNKSSYNNTPNTTVAEEEENWDDEPADTSKQSQPSTPNSLGFFNPNAAKKDDDAAATADGANKNDDGSYLGADNQSTNNNDDFIPRPRGFMAGNNDRGRNFNNRYDKRDNWGNRNDRRDNYNNRNDRRDNWNNRNKFDPRNRDFNSESKNDFHSNKSSYNNTPNTTVAEEEENWDDKPSGDSSAANKSTSSIPFHQPQKVQNSSVEDLQNSSKDPPNEPKSSSVQNQASAVDEENWDDEPSNSTKDSNPPPKNPLPFFTPMKVSTEGSKSPTNNDENSEKDNSNEPQKYSYTPFGQNYENNWHSNKYSNSRNFDRSGKDDFNNYSKGDFRNKPYDRDNKDRRGGRGGRGGFNRGGRGGRDSWNNTFDKNDADNPFGSSLDSRDRSRSRDRGNWEDRGGYRRDREDKGFRDDGGSGGFRGNRGYRGNRDNRGDRRGGGFRGNRDFRGDRNRSYEQDSFDSLPPLPLPSNSAVEPEEDWDAPTGLAKNTSENQNSTQEAPVATKPYVPPPPVPFTATEEAEESWD